MTGRRVRSDLSVSEVVAFLAPVSNAGIAQPFPADDRIIFIAAAIGTDLSGCGHERLNCSGSSGGSLGLRGMA